MTGQDWRSRAACRGVEPELFFPVAESGPQWAAQVAEAKAVCAGCPVRAECLAFALERLPYGIAGGLTAEERAVARRRRRGAGRRKVQRPVASTRREVAAAGREALRAGGTVQAVARKFRVSERTAARWAAQVRGAAPGAQQKRTPRRRVGGAR
jgi:hypothetical protein